MERLAVTVSLEYLARGVDTVPGTHFSNHSSFEVQKKYPAMVLLLDGSSKCAVLCIYYWQKVLYQYPDPFRFAFFLAFKSNSETVFIYWSDQSDSAQINRVNNTRKSGTLDPAFLIMSAFMQELSHEARLKK